MEDETRKEGPKIITIEVPDSWFDAIYEGNAQFPQSNAGIATFLLADLLAKHTPVRQIQALGTQSWRFSDRQKEVLIKGLNAMHARYAIPVASESKGEEVAEGIKTHHGPDAAVNVRELEGDRFDSFAGDTIETAQALFTSLRSGVHSALQEYSEQHVDIISEYVGHAARMLRSDPQIQALLLTHKDRLREYQMLKSPPYAPERAEVFDRVLKTRIQI